MRTLFTAIFVLAAVLAGTSHATAEEPTERPTIEDLIAGLPNLNSERQRGFGYVIETTKFETPTRIWVRWMGAADYTAMITVGEDNTPCVLFGGDDAFVFSADQPLLACYEKVGARQETAIAESIKFNLQFGRKVEPAFSLDLRSMLEKTSGQTLSQTDSKLWNLSWNSFSGKSRGKAYFSNSPGNPIQEIEFKETESGKSLLTIRDIVTFPPARGLRPDWKKDIEGLDEIGLHRERYSAKEQGNSQLFVDELEYAMCLQIALRVPAERKKSTQDIDWDQVAENNRTIGAKLFEMFVWLFPAKQMP